jgi:AcrR family transcriptional regulator
MVIRQRAIQAIDKQERHDAILDAAERLLARVPERVASVAEVADEAGLGKGTVYLYFPSKEELLLAVHERAMDGFFAEVAAVVARPTLLRIDDMLGLTRRHIVEPPLVLPLAARCFGLMAHSIPAAAACAFKERMGRRLALVGAGLEQHFPQLPGGGGVALLRRSYALMIGLWQMSNAAHGGPTSCGVATGGPDAALVAEPFPVELDRALRALWQGTLDAPVDSTPR